MMIETERLQLIPLTPDQLRLWVTDMAELESELGVVYDAEPMEGIFLKIVEGQCGITEKDEAHYVYHTFWFLVRMVPRITAVSENTLAAAPEWNSQIVSTSISSGWVSRLFKACRAIWICTAALIGSMQLSGTAPCPPSPCMVIVNTSLDAQAAPVLYPTLPIL